MTYVLTLLLTLWAFWYLYLIVMGLYRAVIPQSVTMRQARLVQPNGYAVHSTSAI